MSLTVYALKPENDMGKGEEYRCRIVLPLRGYGAGVGALDVWRSRPAVALRVRLRASPSAQDDTRGGGGMPGLVRSTIGDPDLRSPSGFDSGLCPSLRIHVGRKWGAGVSALGVWRSRPAVALRVRLRALPSAHDDTKGGNGRPKFGFSPDLLDFRCCF